jgi:hypothetical protein
LAVPFLAPFLDPFLAPFFDPFLDTSFTPAPTPPFTPPLPAVEMVAPAALAASRRRAALSVRSQVKSESVRPKCP